MPAVLTSDAIHNLVIGQSVFFPLGEISQRLLHYLILYCEIVLKS